MRWLTTFSLVLFFSTNAWTDSVPEWVKKPPIEDATNRYYVGRASDAPNESEAFRIADGDARETAIRENFGTITEVNRQSYEALEHATTVQRINEISRKVRLQGFTRKDQFLESHEGKVSLWMLYAYSKAAIETERKRLAAHVEREEPVQFSEQGDAQDLSKGILEVVTLPGGATVTIDNEAWGRTPLRIAGMLSPGPHILSVDHPNFDMVSENAVVVPGKTTRITRTLVRSTNEIHLETNPEGAEVTLGGKFLGLSPVSAKIPTGERQTLKITHPEASPYASEVEVAKGPPRGLKVQLSLKPAYISFSSSPSGAVVFRNGERIGVTPTGFIQVEPGSYTFTLEKDGYLNAELPVAVHGGQRITLPLVSMTSLSDTEKKQRQEEAARAWRVQHEPWVFGLGLGGRSGSSSSIPGGVLFNIGIEKRLFGRIGLKISGALGATGNKNVDGTTSGASEYGFSTPIYFGKAYLEPEVGFVQTDVTDSIGSRSISQFQYGAGVGYESFDILAQDKAYAGGYIRVGFRKYGDANPYAGGIGVSGSLGILVRW